MFFEDSYLDITPKHSDVIVLGWSLNISIFKRSQEILMAHLEVRTSAITHIQHIADVSALLHPL